MQILSALLIFVFERLTERPHLLLPWQTLQEESYWGLENNVSLESGHSFELGGEERVVISCIKWRALRRCGRIKRPQIFELFDRGFRDEDLVDIISEVRFLPIIKYGSQALNLSLNQSYVTLNLEERANIVPSSSAQPGDTESLLN